MMSFSFSGQESTRSSDQIPVKVHVREVFYFTKYLPENLINTTEDNKERLTSLLGCKFCKHFDR